MQTSQMVLALPALNPEARFTACNFLPDVDEYITQMVDKSSDEQKVAQWTRGRSNKDTGVAMMRTPRSTRTAIIDRCISNRRDVFRHQHVQMQLTGAMSEAEASPGQGL